VYAALLEAVFGSDVGVVCPSPSEHSEESSEFNAEPLLPQAWTRVWVPLEPEALLTGIRKETGRSTHRVVFLLTPWLSFREVAPQIRAIHGRLGLHEIALLITAERASAGVTIASLVPYATVAGDSSRPFRAEFFTRARPALVLTHDGLAGELGLHSNFRTATVAATAGEHDGVTRFFRVPKDCSEADVLAELKRLLAQKGGATQHGYVVRDPLPPGSSLSHDLRSPELTRAKLSLEHLGELRRLDEVFEIRSGLNIAQEKHRVVDVEAKDDLPLLIEGRSIRRGSIAWDSARYRVQAGGRWLLHPGDVLVRALVSPTDERLTVAECPADAPCACAASTVVVLRPQPEVTPEQIRVAVQYLTSRLAMRVVQAMSHGTLHISRPLRRVLLPVADEDLNLAIRELGEAAAQFRAWADQAEQARSDVFERVGPEEWRGQVLRAGARVRERERAAQQVEDLGFRVRTLFPHPLAHSWRVVEASRPDYDGYKTVLETTETLLLYAAVLAFVSAQAIDEPVPYVDVIGERLRDSPDRGVTMGDWYSILTQIRDSQAIRARAGEIPFPEILSLWTTLNAQDAFSRLKSRRDDDGHVRRPEQAEQEAAYHEARSDLELLFAGADFFVEYPLRFVEATRWRSADDSTEYDYRDLRGDHDLVPLELGHVVSHRVEQGSLYVATRRQEIHRVTPVLVRAACPQCTTRHTFCFDRLERGSGAPVYRGLEHRHSATRPDLADDLKLSRFLSDAS
jgi:hypothetical protein